MGISGHTSTEEAERIVKRAKDAGFWWRIIKFNGHAIYYVDEHPPKDDD